MTDADTRYCVAHLAIPPAWQQVWITPFRNGHLQAVGTDDVGHRQDLYHQDLADESSELDLPSDGEPIRVDELSIIVALPAVEQAVLRSLAD